MLCVGKCVIAIYYPLLKDLPFPKAYPSKMQLYEKKKLHSKTKPHSSIIIVVVVLILLIKSIGCRDLNYPSSNTVEETTALLSRARIYSETSPHSKFSQLCILQERSTADPLLRFKSNSEGILLILT